jgi:hypothetical protein
LQVFVIQAARTFDGAAFFIYDYTLQAIREVLTGETDHAGEGSITVGDKGKWE